MADRLSKRMFAETQGDATVIDMLEAGTTAEELAKQLATNGVAVAAASASSGSTPSFFAKLSPSERASISARSKKRGGVKKQRAKANSILKAYN